MYCILSEQANATACEQIYESMRDTFDCFTIKYPSVCLWTYIKQVYNDLSPFHCRLCYSISPPPSPGDTLHTWTQHYSCFELFHRPAFPEMKSIDSLKTEFWKKNLRTSHSGPSDSSRTTYPWTITRTSIRKRQSPRKGQHVNYRGLVTQPVHVSALYPKTIQVVTASKLVASVLHLTPWKDVYYACQNISVPKSSMTFAKHQSSCIRHNRFSWNVSLEINNK